MEWKYSSAENGIHLTNLCPPIHQEYLRKRWSNEQLLRNYPIKKIIFDIYKSFENL